MKQQNEWEARDVFIRFRDMLLYVLLRWRQILLAALVLAVLLTGINYWRDAVRYHSIEQMPKQTEHEPLDADGMARVAAVQGRQKAYDRLCAYNTEALLMQVDFLAVPTRQMGYLLTGARAYAAASLCRTCVSDTTAYAALAKAQTTETAPVTEAYLAELVTVQLEQDTSRSGDGVLLYVSVIAPTEALCNDLAETVQATVEETVTALRVSTGGFAGRWAYDQYTEPYSAAVQTQQQERLAAQEQARLDLKKATDALKPADEDFLFAADKEKEEKTTWTYPAPTLSVAFLLVSFALCVVALAVFYAVRYLYCGRVLSEPDVAVRHGVPVFGSLAGVAPAGPVRRWLCRWLQDEDTDTLLLWQRVTLAAKHAGVEAVYAVGDAARLEGLAACMAEVGIRLSVGPSPLANRDTMRALSEAGALVLTADVALTRHKTVARELELCRQLGCTPLGVIVAK